MRVLIVDDEPLARGVVQAFLEDDPDITHVEESGDGADAAARILGSRFDLVFLDIQMPGVDGFGVIDRIPVEEQPLVVFVTAHENHALRAFSVAAVDYLLKPFDDRRFAVTLGRAKERYRERELSRRGAELAALLDPATSASPVASDRLTVPTETGVRTVDVTTVRWIEAQNKHVTYHVDGADPIRARQSLSDIERRLDPRRFLRVHRSCIVALPRIEALDRTEGGATYASLDSGERVVVSRSRAPVVRARLGSP